MPFETDKLPLETILRVLKGYSWEKVFYLQGVTRGILSAKGGSIKESVTYTMPEGEPEKIRFDKIHLAITNLESAELQIVCQAAQDLLKVLKPDLEELFKRQGGFGIQFSASDDESERVELNLSEAEKQIYDLRSQANQAVHDNDGEKFYAAMDEAIRIAEANDVPPFQLKEMRTTHFPPRQMIDSSKVIPIWEEALTYYRQKGNIAEQLGTLQHLAKRMLKPEDRPRALQLFDEAISLAEQHGFPTFRLRRQKIEIETWGKPNYELVLPYVEEELEYYKRQGNSLQEIQILLNLAQMCIKLDSQRASRYLDQAEARLNALTEADLEAFKQQGKTLMPVSQLKIFLQYRALDIQSYRRDIANPESVNHSRGTSWHLDILPPLP